MKDVSFFLRYGTHGLHVNYQPVITPKNIGLRTTGMVWPFLVE